MSFVHVPDGRVVAQCARKRAHTANTQQHFLHDTQVDVAPVQTGCKLASSRIVDFYVRVEQVKGSPPDAQFPDAGMHRTVREIHADGQFFSIFLQDREHG